MAAHLTPEQLERAIELQRKCWTQQRIADEIGVHNSTVSRSLSRHNRRALRLLERRTAATKAKQADQLEWMADEAVQGWERSQRDEVTTKTTTEAAAPADDPDDAAVLDVKTDRTVRGQAGDPRFIREARGALADVRKILGLDAPTKRDAEAFNLSHLTEAAERLADDYRPEERPADGA